MSPVEGLAYGFSVALTLQNVLAALLGALIGTAIGVLPGIGPMGAMALLLPVTLSLPPATALIMLTGIYFGSQYGGSTTSILVNVPGEATSVVTCIDGYQMSKQGRAGAALAVAAVGSFVAGTLGVVGLMLFAPPLAQLALAFGPPEYATLALLGLVVLSRVSGGSVWKGLVVLSIGLVLSGIGMDPITGTRRFNFGLIDLAKGIEIVPVAMGLFGVTEVLMVAERAGGLPRLEKIKFRELFPTRPEWQRSLPAMLRGAGLGFLLGLIPGPGGIISTFASYRIERRLARHPEEFGHGAIEAVAGPESANNAATTGQMVPLLSLGLPFAPAMALFLAALTMQGVQPGPLLIQERPEIFWGVIASMYVGNTALLILNLPLVGMWVSLLRIPQSLLLAGVLLFMFVGTYSVNNSMFDLVALVLIGIVGYVLRKLDFQLAPMILAVILGPVLEKAIRQSLLLSRGDLFIFSQRPISGAFLAVTLLVLVAPPVWGAFAGQQRGSTDL